MENLSFNQFFSENGIKSKIDAIIFDNKQFIIDFGETVADYLITDIVEGDNQEYNWMHYDGIINYDNLTDSAEKAVITDMLIDFIKENYNYKLNY